MKLNIFDKWREYRENAQSEFFSYIEDLLKKEEVLQLDDFIHHICFTRLRHSLDVAYYSFFIAKLFKWDSESVARAGLLHDLFFYNRADKEHEGNHAVNHPKVALENARLICDLNEIEEDIILKHMWLVTPVPPKYKEGFIVTFVDKYCALKELITAISPSSQLHTAKVIVPVPVSNF